MLTAPVLMYYEKVLPLTYLKVGRWWLGPNNRIIAYQETKDGVVKKFLEIQWGRGYGLIPLSGRWLGGIIYIQGKLYFDPK